MNRNKNRSKSIFLLFFVSFILLVNLNGYVLNEFDANPVNTIWVITELTTADSFNYQIEKAAEAFEAEHEGITLHIEILPTDEAAREIYLDQLRSKIMAGKGPDIYLLPTGSTLSIDSPVNFSKHLLPMQLEVEPLFGDVTQTMYSGVFADISSFYDADANLNTEDLYQDVMDAGVVNGCRYILPLRYTMPVLLTDPCNYEENGITQEMVDSGIDALAQQAIDAQNVMMAMGLRMPNDTVILPRLFDYESGEIVIKSQEIADYMRLYQQITALSKEPTEQMISNYMEELFVIVDEGTHHSFEDPLGEAHVNITLKSFNNVYEYGRYGYHWSLNGFPLYADGLACALDQAAISKVSGNNLQAQPMRSLDGSVIAEITYYGAVGSSCKVPELAYEFLRIFLTEDYQWDLVRPRANRENDTQWNMAGEVQTDGLIENSWPVRVEGSVPYLWDTLQYQNYRDSYIYENYHKALKDQNLDLTDADLPILQTKIDEVRFPFYQSYEETLTYALTLLNNEDGTPTDVDIDQLAGEVWQYLWWHLAEG